MSLPAGMKLGPYEIVAPLGAGGMGEVYRARDTKLGRDVAIKVLRAAFADDAERLARFEREARLLASLNHPNIASIYGLEETNSAKALILELVEGPTLADRLRDGPIPLDEALPVARQIAEALEAGHEAGVIHRDLKPANVKLKDDGTVKVLDYGLAKALEGDTPAGTEAELSQSPTLTRLRQGSSGQARQGTQLGVILGTAAYMSPEQARGKRVDKRTDIWAFGCVLYEMLTGKKAFPGEDVSEILAAVLKLEPDWTRLPPALDPRIDRLLRRCLEKDSKRRRRDIGDVRNEIEEALTSLAGGGGVRSERGRGGLLALLAGAAGLVAGITAATLLRSPAIDRPVRRFTIPLEGRVVFREARAPAISPGGQAIVYAEGNQLLVRHLDRMEPEPIAGTDVSAQTPTFSPDGKWIAFWSDSGLMKMPLEGGTSTALCCKGMFSLRLSWADDHIYFDTTAKGILRVSVNGGEPDVVVTSEGNELSFPWLLPDGRTRLYTSTRGSDLQRGDPALRRAVMAHSLDTGSDRLLIVDGSDARYVSTGHLVYRRGTTLQAVPFDLDRLELSGNPTTVVEGVAPLLTYAGIDSGGASFAVSQSGDLVYVSAGVEDHRLL